MKLLIKDWPASETATIGELIQELQKHDPTIAVAFVWEGQVRRTL